MKKLLLSLATAALFSSLASAETLYSIKFIPSVMQEEIQTYTSTWKCVSEGNSWTIENFNNNKKGWQFIAAGRKNVESVAKIGTDFVSDGTVNQIVLQGALRSANSGETNIMTSAALLVFDTADYTAETEPVSTIAIDADQFKGAKNAKFDITVDVPDSEELRAYQFVFTIAGSSNNGWLEVDQIDYLGEPSVTERFDPEISFPQASYTATIGEEPGFVSPVASTVSDGAVTYSSSNRDIASVDAETGVVTLISGGTTTVTATVAATDTYASGSASYELTVIDPMSVYGSALGQDFTFENFEESNYPWSHDNTYGLKGTGFYSGAIHALEGVAVSPVIDLTKREEVTLDFMNAFNNYKVDNQMIAPEDFDGYAFVVVREEDETEWTILEDAITPPSAFNWNFYENAPVSLKDYEGKKIQVGFKYVSTATCAGTWEVKAIKISGKISTGIADVESVSDAEEVFYNLQGVRIASPSKGVYIKVKGNRTSKVMF